MSATNSLPVSPMRSVLITMDVPEAVLHRFRTEFPEIRFIVPGEDAGADDLGTIVAATPTGDDLREAEGLIGWRLETGTLESAPRLRWLHASGAGVERYALAEIAGRGVMMTNSSGISAPNMAEHVLGMMIALTRRFPALMRSQAARRWRDTDTHREVNELQGQTLLVVGVGDIGQEVARRGAAFGMRVHGVRRRGDMPLAAGFARVFGTAELAESLADADHIVVTLPHTPGTRGLFNAAAFAAMKPGAMIYNVGRGPVIDTEALIAALESGHLDGAGLDVTDPEPLPAESPLWDMENVLITAHTSGATPRYWDRQEALIAETIRCLQRGERPPTLVDLDAGY
jgi:phosphoglycerate dehydrogenase-like enzyme